MARSAIPLADIVGQQAQWLLDLDLGGRIYRFAVDDSAVEDADGNVIAYSSGLEALQLTLSGEPLSAAITIASGGVDWALLVARGVDLTRGTATLRRWYSGQLLEEARVLLAGSVVQPEYGGLFEPLTFSLERTPWNNARMVPPSSQAITTDTWPITQVGGIYLQPDEAAVGVTYPWVFGTPGRSAQQQVLWGTNYELSTHATPAYLAEFGGGASTYRSTKWLIAGHKVDATTVTLVDTSAGYYRNGYVQETLAVSHTVDLLGQTVAYIAVTNAKLVHAIPGNTYWVDWGVAGTGGGRLNADGTAPMRGAGEIAEYLLDAGGVPVARGRWAGARARLDRFRLDFALVEPVEPDGWVQGVLGALLPLCRRETADGVWYELWRHDGADVDVAAHLVALSGTAASGDGLAVNRVGRVVTTPLDDVVNEITIEYCKAADGRYLKRQTLTGSAPDLDAGELGSYVCELSQTRYGKRPVTLQADIVYDDATATLMLHTYSAAYALPRRAITYQGGMELEILDVNSVVRLTDDEIYLDAICLVRAVTLSLTTVEVELEVLELTTTRPT